MKFRAKKILAALLCLCMVAAVIPAGTPQAAAAEGEYSVTFVIGREEICNYRSELIKSTEYTSLPQASQVRWLLEKVTTEYNINYSSDDSTMNYVPVVAGTTLVTSKKGSWFAFDAVVEQDGNYTATMTSVKEQFTNNYKVYLVPSSEITAGAEVESINSAISGDSYLVGTVYGRAVSGTGVTAQNLDVFAGVSLTADDYKLVLVNDEDTTYGGNTYCANKPVSLKLEKVADYNVLSYEFGGQTKVNNRVGFNNSMATYIDFYGIEHNGGLNYILYTGYADMLTSENGWYAFEIKVKEDGIYVPKMFNYALGNASGYTAYLLPASVSDISSNLAEEYSILSASNAEAQAGTDVEGAGVPVKAGKYKLVVKNTGNVSAGTYCRMTLEKFTLTRTGDYGIEFDFAGKEESSLVTPIGSVAFKSASNNNFINQNYQGNSPAGNVNDHGTTVIFDKNGWVAFDVTIGESATYTPKMQSYKSDSTKDYSVFLIPESELTEGKEVNQIKAMVAKDKYMLGTVDAQSATPVAMTDTFDEVSLLKGGYKLVIVNREYDASSYTRNYVMKLNLAYAGEYVEPSEPDAPDGADVLGETYAYLHKDADNKYVLDLFGGVKKLDGYSEVGFIVTVDGTEITTEGTNKVYSNFTYSDGTEIPVTSFGQDCQFVFTESASFDESVIGKTVVIKAYAVKSNGETVYGYELAGTIE